MKTSGEHQREEGSHNDAIALVGEPSPRRIAHTQQNLSNLSAPRLPQTKTFREFPVPLPEHHAKRGHRREHAQNRPQDHDEQQEEVEQGTHHGIIRQMDNSNPAILAHAPHLRQAQTLSAWPDDGPRDERASFSLTKPTAGDGHRTLVGFAGILDSPSD